MNSWIIIIVAHKKGGGMVKSLERSTETAVFKIFYTIF